MLAHQTTVSKSFTRETFSSAETVTSSTVVQSLLPPRPIDPAMMRIGDLHLCADDATLRAYAVSRAAQCRSLAQQVSDSAAALSACAAVAHQHGIEPPTCGDTDADTDDLAPVVARLGCERWWRRRLRVAQAHRLESVWSACGVVRSDRDEYISAGGLRLQKFHRERQQRLMERLVAISESGDVVPLAEIAERTVANPRIRRIEMMTRVSGLERWAIAQGMVVDFYTVTAPSAFHRWTTTRSGIKRINGRFDPSTTPRDAQAWLRRRFARVGAALHRRGIQVFGMRVCEPHGSGTPHWHLLLWCRPEHRSTVRAIYRHYYLQDDDGSQTREPGAKKHRVKIKPVHTTPDPDTGRPRSAVGYLAKYVGKNVDGTSLPESESHSVERVRAWASTWRFRQFQMIGVRNSSVWREFRRLKECSDDLMESARHCASAGDYENFLAIVLAYDDGKFREKIKILRNESRTTVYGDRAPGRVVGVVADNGSKAISRTREWKIMTIDDAAEFLYEIISRGGDAEFSSTNTGIEQPPDPIPAPVLIPDHLLSTAGAGHQFDMIAKAIRAQAGVAGPWTSDK
ncbi:MULTISPECIES: replication endonuclease [unclassified Microbulbifer]|uniref:replication endonuclease n=1 Tax=unclassified Microbulbifer TaxID=2619833 RepID=UPI0027E48A8B|nr:MULTISPECIES: replication endonuclease [unclassified Microbulbifer]